MLSNPYIGGLVTKLFRSDQPIICRLVDGSLIKEPSMPTSTYVSPTRVDNLNTDALKVRVFAVDKRRKPSHAERKKKLEEEILLLESGVAVLKTRGLPPQLLLQKDPLLRPVAVEFSTLMYSINTQQLRVAKMQSALSQCLTDQQYYPLYSHIKLTKDWKERRGTLLAMRDQKIRNALNFVMGPGGINDAMKKQSSQNQFENEEGDLCCVLFDTIQFPGVKSLQQVYDALSFYKNNMEIIITEQLGHITIREDYDEVNEAAFHTRILSTNEDGITTEGNVVSFRAMLSDGYNGEPCAVMVGDSVDEDDKYPYLSHRYVRKDISTAVVLTENRNTGDKSDVVVTMRRAAFYKVRRPEFPVTFCELENLRDATTQWSDVMLKTIRGILYPTKTNN
ncbi:hypothetical protein L914_19413 [Phytophthora nicotianae]|uniref:Uncharacterized protein n=3 Tax=Phytophthora nicotianae TaxID=4792 RepID=V9E1X7_PHYNI|nr:hypothetical protein F443_20194 [Phytophthora nicotianae P1569]ETM33325.1 hypothetical protein L914_19413 [Phytophthora nicotianae]